MCEVLIKMLVKCSLLLFVAIPALATECSEQMSWLDPKPTNSDIEYLCERAQRYDLCESVEKRPIWHFDATADNSNGKKILVMGLIHGDEAPSGIVALNWILRLKNIQPRNHWRVIPISNPDSFKMKTRTNKNGVDLNRNFPTQGWEITALNHWKSDKKSDPRRYPGPEAGSEPETKCYLKHIAEFKPDLVISIHTPLGVLDFDGPKITFPAFKPLPWTSLGNFDGSLGRFMWRDNNKPVLTVELKGNSGVKSLEDFDRLQDISGTVAIQTQKALKDQAQNNVKQKNR